MMEILVIRTNVETSTIERYKVQSSTTEQHQLRTGCYFGLWTNLKKGKMLRKLFFSRHEYRSFDYFQGIINSKFALRSSYSSLIHQFHDSTLPQPRTQPCAIGLENEPRVRILICQNLLACSCFTFLCLWHLVAFILSIHITMFVH